MQPNQPSNGLIGDNNPIDLPQKPVDDEAIAELRHKAKYTRSKEYKDLREKAQVRIDFYKKFLPNGQLIGTASREEMQGKWELANLLIAEFEQLFGEHEIAEEILKEVYGE